MDEENLTMLLWDQSRLFYQDFLGGDTLLLTWAEGELVHSCQEMVASTMDCGGQGPLQCCCLFFGFDSRDAEARKGAWQCHGARAPGP